MLIACGGEHHDAATTTSTATAAQTTTVAPAPAAATEPDPAGAEKLVKELYATAETDQRPFFQTKDRALVDKYFESTLAELIWKDAVEANGEIGALDFDPRYDAQDSEIKNLVVQPAQREGSDTKIAVTFENFGKKQQINYTLVPAGDSWKITNMTFADGRTLRDVYRPAATTGTTTTTT